MSAQAAPQIQSDTLIHFTSVVRVDLSCDLAESGTYLPTVRERWRLALFQIKCDRLQGFTVGRRCASELHSSLLLPEVRLYHMI